MRLASDDLSFGFPPKASSSMRAEPFDNALYFNSVLTVLTVSSTSGAGSSAPGENGIELRLLMFFASAGSSDAVLPASPPKGAAVRRLRSSARWRESPFRDWTVLLLRRLSSLAEVFGFGGVDGFGATATNFFGGGGGAFGGALAIFSPEARLKVLGASKRRFRPAPVRSSACPARARIAAAVLAELLWLSGSLVLRAQPSQRDAPRDADRRHVQMERRVRIGLPRLQKRVHETAVLATWIEQKLRAARGLRVHRDFIAADKSVPRLEGQRRARETPGPKQKWSISPRGRNSLCAATIDTPTARLQHCANPCKTT